MSPPQSIAHYLITGTLGEGGMGAVYRASTESGPNEVFVRPVPGQGGKWKVSSDGGKYPAWSRAARQLFYFGADDCIMVADYTVRGEEFVPGKPRASSHTPIRRTGVLQNFDVRPDGKRVVMFPRPERGDAGPVHATVLLNFFDEVRRRIP